MADDAPPSTAPAGVLRISLFLAARGGCRGALAAEAGALAAEAAQASQAAAARRPGDGRPLRAIVLEELDDDPFPAANPRLRPPEVVLELQAAGASADELVGLLAGAPARLGPSAHLDLSTVVVGVPWEVVPCEPTPLRYQYLMRRRADHDRAAYLAHYGRHHSAFGRRTPGIAGYTQVHADPVASAGAAHRLGIGGWAVDSVSELHLRSLEEFFAAVATDGVGAEALADEERFVDRGASVSGCGRTTVVAPG
jgi:hypothetical protein